MSQFDVKEDVTRRIKEIDADLDDIHRTMLDCRDMTGNAQIDEEQDKRYSQYLTRYSTLLDCLIDLYKAYREAEPSLTDSVTAKNGKPHETTLQALRKKNSK